MARTITLRDSTGALLVTVAAGPQRQLYAGAVPYRAVILEVHAVHGYLGCSLTPDEARKLAAELLAQVEEVGHA